MSKWASSLTGVGIYGEWANVTVYPDFPNDVMATTDQPTKGLSVPVTV